MFPQTIESNALTSTPLHRRTLISATTAAVLATLLGACAAPPERYALPATDGATAEVQVNLMGRSRNFSAALYVPGAVKCNPSALTAMLNRTIEDPPRLVAGSWDNRFREVVTLPAGVPLPLRFRYQAPGDDWIFDFVVQLQPGARYVFEHEIPGRSFTLKDSVSGLPAPRLPPRWFRDAVICLR